MYFLLNIMKMGDFPSQSSGHCRGKPTFIQPSAEEKTGHAQPRDATRRRILIQVGKVKLYFAGVFFGGRGVSSKWRPWIERSGFLGVYFCCLWKQLEHKELGILLREVCLDLCFRPIHKHYTEFCGCGRSGHVLDIVFFWDLCPHLREFVGILLGQPIVISLKGLP